MDNAAAKASKGGPNMGAYLSTGKVAGLLNGTSTVEGVSLAHTKLPNKRIAALIGAKIAAGKLAVVHPTPGQAAHLVGVSSGSVRLALDVLPYPELVDLVAGDRMPLAEAAWTGRHRRHATAASASMDGAISLAAEPVDPTTVLISAIDLIIQDAGVELVWNRIVAALSSKSSDGSFAQAAE
jgi:hypothetical protein